MDRDKSVRNSESLREAAEVALLQGQIDEALRMIDKAVASEGRTLDLLMKAEILCAAGELEKGMALLKDNMSRFEADLSPREKKNRLDPALRKVADYLLKAVEALYEEERYVESLAFAQRILTEYNAFLKTKRHRELFAFAWKSSYDEVIDRLYYGKDYGACIDAVDAALTRFRRLTTFGQRNRYKKIRAWSYMRTGRYGKGMVDYLSVPGVLFTLIFFLLVVYGIQAGYQAISTFSFFSGSKKQITAKNSSSSMSSGLAATPLPPRPAIQRAEISSLKLFEVNGEIPAIGARNYQSSFRRQSGRIFVEVLFKNLNYLRADVTMPLFVRFYGPSGDLVQEVITNSSPRKEYSSAITSVGWRPEGPAGWPPGRYVVKVSLDGEPEQETSFEVR